MPTLKTPIEDPPHSTGEPVYRDLLHAVPGQAGAAQNFDGNGPSVRYHAGLGDRTVSLGVPGTEDVIGLTSEPILGSRPKFTNQLPPFRPDVPCTSQEPPNLEAETGPAPEQGRANIDYKKLNVGLRRLCARAREAGRPMSNRMRHTLRQYAPVLAAIVFFMVAAGGVAFYILDHVRFRFPWDEVMEIEAEFAHSQAITPGQGQEVTVAGVKVGDVGPVELEDGHAVVRLDLVPDEVGPVYQNATLLIRPKTLIQDQSIALDPGTPDPSLPDDGRLEEGDQIPRAQTQVNVNTDEVIAMLDVDTRDYLRTLLDAGGQGLKDRGPDLRALLELSEPTFRQTERVVSALAERRQMMRTLVSNLRKLSEASAEKDTELAGLVDASATTFQALGEREAELTEATERLPGTLAAARDALADGRELVAEAGPALEALRPAARRLGPALVAAQPLLRSALPIVRDDLRPLVREGIPLFKQLRPTLRDLNRATPRLVQGRQGAQLPRQRAGLQPAGLGGGLPLLALLVRAQRALDGHGRRRPRPGRARPGPVQLLEPRHGRRSGSDRADHRGTGGLPVIKQAPPLSRVIAMIVFALSCFSIVLFLWISFGGPVPLKAKGYRFTADLTEATLLVNDADVRISGVTVGSVVKSERVGNVARATIEMKSKYAPIPEDTRVTLRQKTLGGETYVELSPGNPDGKPLEDGGALPTSQARETSEIDEVLSNVLDPKTRESLRQLFAYLATASEGRGEDVNNALGHAGPLAEAGGRLLRVIAQEREALRRLTQDGGFVLDTVGRRQGELSALVRAGDRVLRHHGAPQRRAGGDDPDPADHAARAAAHAPGARGLRARGRSRWCASCARPARSSGPALVDASSLAPDVRGLFRDVDDVIDIAERALPATTRTVNAAVPVFQELAPALRDLLPVVDYLGLYPKEAVTFFAGVASAFGYTDVAADGKRKHYFRSVIPFSPEGLVGASERLGTNRHNPYIKPGWLDDFATGLESIDCENVNNTSLPDTQAPPCKVQPPVPFRGRSTAYPQLRRAP